MADLKDKLPGWATPQIFVSGANFLAIVFTCGVIYSTAQGKLAAAEQDIRDLKTEVRGLRDQGTSIAVVRADLSAVKESVTRIERQLERRPPG